MTMTFHKEIADQLIRHEGIRLTPYRCPAGRLTIGVGRNIEDKGISEKEAMILLPPQPTCSPRSYFVERIKFVDFYGWMHYYEG